MSQFAILRAGAQIVAGLGVTKVVADVIKNNTVVTTQMEQLGVLVGKTVLTSMIVDQAMTHVDQRLDAARDWYKKRKNGEEEKPATEEPPPVVG